MMITANGRARDWQKFFFPGLVVTLNGEIIKDIAEADDDDAKAAAAAKRARRQARNLTIQNRAAVRAGGAA